MYNFDIWLYPQDLDGEYLVINLFADNSDVQINKYELPLNWREIVTQDKGKDGKPSIHDIMQEVAYTYPVCPNEEENNTICNSGYACDGCPCNNEGEKNEI